MAHPNGHVVLERGQHRMFMPMLKLCTIVDALVTAAGYHLGRAPEKKFNGMLARQFPIQVGLPGFDPMYGFSQGLQPAKVHMRFDPAPQSTNYTQYISGFEFDPLALITPYYVDFVEEYKPWLKGRFGGDRNTWPMLFNFAVVIRNFISHTAGNVHFDNRNAPPVTWHNLTYSPANEGQRVLSTDILIRDLIVLLFEMSEELDNLGCPI